MKKGIGKIIIASALGTMVEIAGLMSSISYNVFLGLIFVLELPLMMRFLLGNKKHILLKATITGYLFLIVINGLLEVFWNWFAKKQNYIGLVCLSCFFVGIGVFVWIRQNQLTKGVCFVKLERENSIEMLYAFYDSGNKLKDPYTGKGVHILSRKVAERLNFKQDEKVIIPFQTLGNEAGVIEVFYLDKLFIEDKNIELHNSPIGVTEDKLFEGKNYKMILNEEVF